MREVLRLTRLKLKEAVKAEYDGFIEEAKLTPMQEKILRLHICHSLPLLSIADRLYLSESCIKHHLNVAYEHIARVLAKDRIIE